MHIRGFVLNLASASARRERIRNHLSNLPLPGRYELVQAQVGSTDANQRGQLTRGEDGLWRSCLAVLAKVANLAEPIDCIHLLEDDAVISREFCGWAKRVQIDQLAENTVIFTDMFVESTLFAQLQPEAAKAFAQQTIQLLAGQHYSGCTASWLIPHRQIECLRAALTQAYHQPADQRLPLDIAIRQLLQEKRLEGAVTFPFLTSIELHEQGQSSIQDQRQPQVEASNRFNALLRRRLSFCRETNDYASLGNLLTTLFNDATMEPWLAQLALDLHHRKVFRYIHDPRLLHLPNNPQAEGLS